MRYLLNGSQMMQRASAISGLQCLKQKTLQVQSLFENNVKYSGKPNLILQKQGWKLLPQILTTKSLSFYKWPKLKYKNQHFVCISLSKIMVETVPAMHI